MKYDEAHIIQTSDEGLRVSIRFRIRVGVGVWVRDPSSYPEYFGGGSL